MGVINEGLRFVEPQTVFCLGDVDLLEGMAARVRIAPRGWLQPCGDGRHGDVVQHFPACGCRGEVVAQRFPLDLDATLMFGEQAVLLETPCTDAWPDGLYEAQIILLFHGAEMPVDGLVLFELGDA
ncbi:hypothetical protein VSS37_03715 [Candidatus Thiothrix sp. Deng01]|uniref:Uncharacterized protein n=1 Tax=Candidatus Thiothrix phosphatis TaxID=3112415 RepID=A0ABU6CUM9_9GAMM|nr:hypothetical protein [Candidatus Thiothrix sp. Deng01]MEB4590078.1 hypothetical protein [Candidatus Thiothrix sp. Deng01]